MNFQIATQIALTCTLVFLVMRGEAWQRVSTFIRLLSIVLIAFGVGATLDLLGLTMRHLTN